MKLSGVQNFALLALATAGGIGATPPAEEPSTGRLWQLQAVRSTTTVRGYADDCAIWIHPSDPGRCLILGTDKAKGQGIHVWDLQGEHLQFLRVERPNNIDVRQNVLLGKARLDVAVVTIRGERGLRVYRIDRDRAEGPLTDITIEGGIPTPELDDPYGICLYVRHRDGALFAFASTAAGDRGRLHQYRLEADTAGRIRGLHVRALGEGAIRDKVEGLVADDALGLVYAGDEKHAVRTRGRTVLPDGAGADRWVACGDGADADRSADVQCARGARRAGRAWPTDSSSSDRSQT